MNHSPRFAKGILSLGLSLALAALTSCATVQEEPNSEIIFTPWTGAGSALPQMSGGSVDISYDPLVTYAVFVPERSSLSVGVPRGERWIVWLRGLSSGESMALFEGSTRTVPGPEVMLLSVAYVDSRADNPYFGSVVHVEDYPKLSVGSQKLRAVWERRGDAKEDLVLEMSVR